MVDKHHPALAEGHVAVVTGGGGGIGHALAYRLGGIGMRIVLADLPGEALDHAVEGLASLGIDAIGIATDVGDENQIAHLAEAASSIGPVSLLCNNAGREGDGLLSSPELWRRTLATNLLGPLYGIQTFLPMMLEADWPCAIVNTGSKQGITLPPGGTAYNVSKAGLKALTEALAHDLLATSGRITAHLLIPGYTYTGFAFRRGVRNKPEAAWTPAQVVDFALDAMRRGDFYILCPDNEVDRETDQRRIAWSCGDIIHNRPALSRWHPDFAEAYEAHMVNAADSGDGRTTGDR